MSDTITQGTRVLLINTEGNALLTLVTSANDEGSKFYTYAGIFVDTNNTDLKVHIAPPCFKPNDSVTVVLPE